VEPKDLARIILRRKRTVITALVVVALTSLVGSVRKEPQYVAACDVLFQATAYNPTDPSARPIETVGTLASNAEILKSPVITQRAAVLADLPPAVVAGKLNVEIIQDAQIFHLQVADTEGPRAGAICNAYGTAYIEYKREEARKEYERLLAQVNTSLDGILVEYEDVKGRLSKVRDTSSDDYRSLVVERDSLLKEKSDLIGDRAAIKNVLKSGINGGGNLYKPSGGGEETGKGLRRDVLLGLLVGLMFGIGIALVREYLDDTMKDKESTQRELGIPVLAAIPDEGFDGYEPSPGTIEAARQLRATLGSVGFPHEKSVLVITSTLSKARTTTLAALAAAVAESGRSVLVVGSDLRGGRTHESFGVANTVGLANVARGQVALERAIRPAPGLDNVYVLPAGPLVGNPGELLSSEEMAFVLRRARRWADVVLLDAPPVLAAADASVLGAYADGVLLVVSAGQTNRAQANEAKEQLVAAGARLLGAVLVGTDDGGRAITNGYGGDDFGALVPVGGAWSSYDDAHEYDWWDEDEVTTATARAVPRNGSRRGGPKKKTAAAGVNKRTAPARKREPKLESPRRTPTARKAGTTRKAGTSRTSGTGRTSGTTRKAGTGSTSGTARRTATSRGTTSRKPAAKRTTAASSGAAKHAQARRTSTRRR